VGIQSQRGGTKISWDSWHLNRNQGTYRQEFDLAAPEPAVEAERLIALGATLLGNRDQGPELADPDGIVFSISIAY
jgi:Glyoxalase-like domain